jgi:hypothetical protein
MNNLIRRFSSQEPHVMRAVKITQSELPSVLPPGSRCDFYSTPISQFKAGDVVVLPDGTFRRCLLCHGKHLWLTDESGLHVERHTLVGCLYRADVKVHSFSWLAASCLGLIARAPRTQRESEPTRVEADPRQLWRAGRSACVSGG